MDPPHPPNTTTAESDHHHLPPMSPTAPKIRLMVSYGGHIVPRPNGRSLFYAGGETRIIALDRRTTGSSLSLLTTHLSRTLFNNRPFHLKYQLPNEDLDSLISVSTEEDLINMLEEHDRVSTVPSLKPARIRLFLFPIKPESVGSALIDPKAETWFSDALKNTGIVQRGQSADAGLINGLMGLDIISGPDMAQVEGKNGVELGGGVPESMVLETSSSFGSTSSSVSMSNLPPIGVQCEDSSLGVLDKKVRVPSSASIESDISVGSPGIMPKPVVFQESPRRVASGVSTFTIEPETTVADPSAVIQLQKTVQVSGYQFSQQSDGKQHQHEVQYIQGNTAYVPQYSTGPLPPAPYYPVYQIPMHQQQLNPYQVNQVNQPYPVYLVPVRPAHSYNMSLQSNVNNNQTMASSRPPLHPQTATVIPPMVQKELLTAQPSVDSAAKFHGAAQAAMSLVSVSSGQSQQQVLPSSESAHPSQSNTTAPMDSTNSSAELDENSAYVQIYKTQPSVPVLSSHYPVNTMGATVSLSDSSKQQHTNAVHLATSHP